MNKKEKNTIQSQVWTFLIVLFLFAFLMSTPGTGARFIDYGVGVLDLQVSGCFAY